MYTDYTVMPKRGRPTKKSAKTFGVFTGTRNFSQEPTQISTAPITSNVPTPPGSGSDGSGDHVNTEQCSFISDFLAKCGNSSKNEEVRRVGYSRTLGRSSIKVECV